jgi:hypothetical protein
MKKESILLQLFSMINLRLMKLRKSIILSNKCSVLCRSVLVYIAVQMLVATVIACALFFILSIAVTCKNVVYGLIMGKQIISIIENTIFEIFSFTFIVPPAFFLFVVAPLIIIKNICTIFISRV